MALIVQKYGGAVLSDISKIRAVAKNIAEVSQKGDKIVAVVSAMGHTTDDLIRLASSVSLNPPNREMDMLLTVGERVTMSLLAMAIYETGLAKAISYTGSQVGIITDNRHSEARIVAVHGDRLNKALNDGFVVIVAGFQGVSVDKEITTLGRGGSDTTAVALAAALGADRCDLIKEVPGIFSSDPTVIPGAIPIPEMDYEGAKGISLGGARILKETCIDIAKQHNIELRVGNNNNQTKIMTYTDIPYISVTLKGNIIIYIFDNIFKLKNVPEADEILIIDGKIHVFHQTDRKFDPPEESYLLKTGYSLITAAGKNAGKLLDYMQEENDIDDIALQSCQGNTAKVVFKSENPKEVLKQIHDKLLKST